MRYLIAILIAPFLAAQTPDLPVEQTKKNIKVLTGVPSSQLIPTMAFMANSLGVTCAQCHGQVWESDEKPSKEAARRMIGLQRELNAKYYDGKTVVTCNTCHQGRVTPPATPDVANAGWNRTAPPPPVTPLQPAVQFLPKNPEGATSRVVRGTVERFNGRDAPKSEPFALKLSGEKVEYNTPLPHPPEATRALAIYLLAFPPMEKLSGEEWTVDTTSGTLTRRSRVLVTPLGILPEQIDYADYRDAVGARLPFFARWSRADYRVTYTIQAIESGGAVRQ
jgi:hypothetical protein